MGDQWRQEFSGETEPLNTRYASHFPPRLPLRRYTPDAAGFFAGQTGYGYQSIARFIGAAADVSGGRRCIADVRAEGVLALADSTLAVTAILEAGRLSLDEGGAAVAIKYGNDGQPCALQVQR